MTYQEVLYAIRVSLSPHNQDTSVRQEPVPTLPDCDSNQEFSSIEQIDRPTDMNEITTINKISTDLTFGR